MQEMTGKILEFFKMVDSTCKAVAITKNECWQTVLQVYFLTFDNMILLIIEIKDQKFFFFS